MQRLSTVFSVYVCYDWLATERRRTAGASRAVVVPSDTVSLGADLSSFSSALLAALALAAALRFLTMLASSRRMPTTMDTPIGANNGV